MTRCPHADAEIVLDLQPIYVGNGDDAPMAVDIYFCPDCQQDFACKADTFEIVSPHSMRTSPHDTGSDAANEVYDGRF